jgi:CRP/FNR family transcriptional regulator, polysaccharide utilization system transcription regulator
MKIEQPECQHCASRNSSLFYFCHLHELEHIEEAKTCSVYKHGQVIFHEGTNPIGLYCVNAGKVKISKTAPDGKEQIIRFAKPGDFLGYCSLLAGQPYGASATALEGATVCLVPKQCALCPNKLFRNCSMKTSNSQITW